MHKSFAQTKKAIPANNKTSQKDTLMIIERKATKIIDPKNKAATKTSEKKPDTVFVYKERPKKTHKVILPPIRRDTMIVIRKGKQEKMIMKDLPKKPDSSKIAAKTSEACKCVSLNVTAPDILQTDDYINYSFNFKNNCKEIIWVNSSCFGFSVLNADGTPAKVIRKLAYVKQYRYPDFVPISPGEEYSFQFGDDAFFQYQLNTGAQYKFCFSYNNNGSKYKKAPPRTYQCNELRDKTILISNRPAAKK